MKYYLILLLLFFPSVYTNAATYWVDGSFKELSQREVNNTASYVSQVPDSFMEAKQNKKCFVKFETVKERLISFDLKNKDSGLKAKDLIIAKDKLIIELDKKFIQPCLKEYGTNEVKSKSSARNHGYEDLEVRIKLIERQIKEIIQALQSMGKLTLMKGD